MKKVFIFLLVLVLGVSVLLLGVGCKKEAGPAEEVVEEEVEETVEETGEEIEEETEEAEEVTEEEKEPVTLKYQMWLPEPYITLFDTIYDSFEAQYPWITVEQVMVADDGTYDSSLQTEMGLGEGADIFWAKPFAPSRNLYDAGYLVELLGDNVPLLSTFPEALLGAYISEEGTHYAIPFITSAHGIYYNKVIFDANNLTEPQTWAELIDVCEALETVGIQPFTNGLLEVWVEDQIWFPGLGANFFGGNDAAKAMAEGTMKFSDQPFVDAFAAMKQLQQYHPDDFLSVGYLDGIYRFLGGEGAMIIDGSWIEVGFVDLPEGIEVDWFGPPVANEGDTPWFCLEPTGIGINKASKHPEEAILFLNWCTTPEFGQLFYDNIAGSLIAIPGDFTLLWALDQKISDYAQTANITTRIGYNIYDVQDPAPSLLIEEAFAGLFNDTMTPEEAAQHVQDGMATWYPPFME